MFTNPALTETRRDLPPPDLATILVEAEGDNRQAEARRRWSVVWERLFFTSEAAGGFSDEMLGRKLGRPPTPEEVAAEWAAPLLRFGRVLVDVGAENWPDDLPERTPEQGTVKNLLRVSCRVEGLQQLTRELALVHRLEQFKPEFYTKMRAELRRCLDSLLKRARETFGPSQSRPRSPGMADIDAEMDDILRRLQAQRQEEEAREQLHQEQLDRRARLRELFSGAAQFTLNHLATELGRAVTSEDFYPAWAQRLAVLGRYIRDEGLLESLTKAFNPEPEVGRWVRRESA